MNLKTVASTLLLSFFLLSPNQTVSACSMYKVTADGKTMVGCNEDAWRTSSTIWLETPRSAHEYGACFTGSRKVGLNKFAPQSGMNEMGLVFSRLTAFHPIKSIDQTGKKQIINEVQYLTDILHTCQTIDDVKAFIDLYDHSVFIDDIYIYIDRSGDYLLVEPYQTIKGNEPSYVLGNFCPSITDDQQARKQLRYKSGKDYITEHGLGSSLEYCRNLSDSMHVCRKRNGDGTLLTSIWDTQQGIVNLYFYHDYWRDYNIAFIYVSCQLLQAEEERQV